MESGDQSTLRKNEQDELIPLMLDEATAAAYFFLHRRIFESPGGLRAFRYLHPKGFYLLLYDCGAGTTDIALVKAVAPSRDRLQISVLGRSGLRDFGGDNITEEIFRLLKARIAWEMCENEESLVPQLARGRLTEPPPSPVTSGGVQAWRSYYASFERWIDRIVPTRFHPEIMAHDDAEHLRIAINLWEWAEWVKMNVPEGEDGVVGLDNANTYPAVEGSRVAEHLAGNDAKAASRIHDLLRRICVRRGEIDALVRDRVEHSIECCNALIRSKLGDNAPDPEDRGNSVDCLCVVGNAARYPLIQSLLRTEVHVPFLAEDEERYQFELDHLKHAVAKGAALALATRDVQGLAIVDFQTDLYKRLPFDVVYMNDVNAAPTIIFQEGEYYRNLQKPIRVVPSTANTRSDAATTVGKPKYFLLLHRRPGDEKPSEFLKFYFKDGISGEISVSYDERKSNFLASDERNPAGITPVRDRNCLPHSEELVLPRRGDAWHAVRRHGRHIPGTCSRECSLAGGGCRAEGAVGGRQLPN